MSGDAEAYLVLLKYSTAILSRSAAGIDGVLSKVLEECKFKEISGEQWW